LQNYDFSTLINKKTGKIGQKSVKNEVCTLKMCIFEVSKSYYMRKILTSLVVAAVLIVMGSCSTKVDLYDDYQDCYQVADNVGFLLVEDARRDNVQYVADAVELQGVSGVWAALEARDYIIFGRQNVHDFAFAFVAPLQAEQNVHFHISVV
jgi:hypothetical protein